MLVMKAMIFKLSFSKQILSLPHSAQTLLRTPLIYRVSMGELQLCSFDSPFTVDIRPRVCGSKVTYF